MAQTPADGLDIDLEMIRPGLGIHGGFGVDAPGSGRAGTWGMGALVQYQLSPMRVYTGNSDLGPVVAHRSAVQLHAGVSPLDRLSVSVMVPLAVHFGGDRFDYGQNGFGMGDMALSLRWHAMDVKRFNLGLLGTALLPTGADDRYMGERLPRLRAGLLSRLDWSRFDFQTNLLFHVRERVESGFDFTAGSEFHLELAGQIALRPSRLDLIVESITRVGLASGQDGGRVASEVVGGLRVKTDGGVRFDFAVGRGLTEGYGTSGVRAILGVSYVKIPRPKVVVPPPPPELVMDDEPLPEAVDDPPPPPPKVEEPEPDRLARLEEKQIVIRDPIEFEVGTTILRPHSHTILDAVAAVLIDNPRIGHLVIEGHASQEGSFAYNYELSLNRARAIYEAIVLRGVYPARLSYRGAGEVERIAMGDDAASMERNRRVVFHVVRQYRADEELPVYPKEVLLPWSGEAHATREKEPVMPAPDAPEAEPTASELPVEESASEQPVEDVAPEPEEAAPDPAPIVPWDDPNKTEETP